MKVALILFIIFGSFFEMIFGSFSGMIFPILLILLGGYLVLSRSGLLGGGKKDKAHDVSHEEGIPPVS